LVLVVHGEGPGGGLRPGVLVVGAVMVGGPGISLSWYGMGWVLVVGPGIGRGSCLVSAYLASSSLDIIILWICAVPS